MKKLLVAVIIGISMISTVYANQPHRHQPQKLHKVAEIRYVFDYQPNPSQKRVLLDCNTPQGSTTKSIIVHRSMVETLRNAPAVNVYNQFCK